MNKHAKGQNVDTAISQYYFQEEKYFYLFIITFILALLNLIIRLGTNLPLRCSWSLRTELLQLYVRKHLLF